MYLDFLFLGAFGVGFLSLMLTCENAAQFFYSL